MVKGGEDGRDKRERGGEGRGGRTLTPEEVIVSVSVGGLKRAVK